MEATVTIKLDPREFDLIRKALEDACEHEGQLQEHIKDEALNVSQEERIEATRAVAESTAREAQYALLLERLT